MPRITVDVYAVIENLLPEFCFAAGSGERAAAFFSTPCVESKSEKPQQIRNCLRLENRRIHAGFKHTRIASFKCFADRFVGDARTVEFRNVEMIAEEVTGAR